MSYWDFLIEILRKEEENQIERPRLHIPPPKIPIEKEVYPKEDQQKRVIIIDI